MLPSHVCNILTKTSPAGNPLAIVEQAGGQEAGQMQALAQQFDLSETILVRTATRGSTARVGIFFPGGEIPFAGRLTIDCAIHLAKDRLNRIGPKEQAGDVPVAIKPRSQPRSPPRISPSAIPARSIRVWWRAPSIWPWRTSAPTRSAPRGAGRRSCKCIGRTSTRLAVPARSSRTAPPSLPRSNRPTAPELDAICLHAEAPGGFRARLLAPTGGISEARANGSATALLAGRLRPAGALADGRTVQEIALKQWG